MDANIRIEEESLKEMKHIASNLNIGREMSHSIEMIKSLAIQTDGLVETWARKLSASSALSGSASSPPSSPSNDGMVVRPPRNSFNKDDI